MDSTSPSTPTQAQSFASGTGGDATELGGALACLKELVGLLLAAQSKGIDLDKVMDAQECADWLGLTKGVVNLKARNGDIPAFRVSDHTWRFHPRTILEQGHAKQMIKPGKKRKKRVQTLPIAA